MVKLFDIGMYDGADTAYYLKCGYDVVAVEANPDLVVTAREVFRTQIVSGRLVCINAAISPDGGPCELTLCGQDLGSSSLLGERVAKRQPLGTVTIPGVTLPQLFEKFGVPDYVKVDIEGSDRLCVLSLTPKMRPTFLSFELGNDSEELLEHIQAIGYRRFKIINQISFRELANQHCLYDRAAHRIIRLLGYREPHYVRRAGYFFVSGRSSGPVPWQSDGRWWSGKITRTRLREITDGSNLLAWYDLHATVS